MVEQRLEHENEEAKRFYEGLKERALVGIESTGYAQWFAEMLAELGHELVVGEAAKIRRMEVRKQKHDRRDTEHLLNLLVRGGRFSTDLATERRRARRTGAPRASSPIGAVADAGEERAAIHRAESRQATRVEAVDRAGKGRTEKLPLRERRAGAAA